MVIHRSSVSVKAADDRMHCLDAGSGLRLLDCIDDLRRVFHVFPDHIASAL
jgi:hypothetical protein